MLVVGESGKSGRAGPWETTRVTALKLPSLPFALEPEDWPERIRRYEDEYPAGPRRPLVVPIPLLGCAHA